MCLVQVNFVLLTAEHSKQLMINDKELIPKSSERDAQFQCESNNLLRKESYIS
jgi:hypothetical protein